MQKIFGTLCAGALLAAAITPAVAQVNRREANQQERIDQGVRSGELTGHEANKLERQQGRIARTAARERYRNGGYLTHGERARLAARQDRASARIYRQKHDAQVRPY